MEMALGRQTSEYDSRNYALLFQGEKETATGGFDDNNVMKEICKEKKI